jgi:hypothetical protein
VPEDQDLNPKPTSRVGHGGSEMPAATGTLGGAPILPQSDPEPVIEGKWRPATRLIFLVASSALLWAAIYVAFQLAH